MADDETLRGILGKKHTSEAKQSYGVVHIPLLGVGLFNALYIELIINGTV